MLRGREFLALLRRAGIDFATGVPCSLIEDLIRELETAGDMPYVAAVREDVAVGIAAGAWLAGRRPAVLIQNSGLGTSLNALASLPLMYGIPLLAIVTWRGHRGKDAPEHILTGAITEPLLELLGIPHRVLSAGSAADDIAWAVAEMDRRAAPVALLVPPHVFAEGGSPVAAMRPAATATAAAVATTALPASQLARQRAIAAAVARLGDTPIIHANGYLSREAHAAADRSADFYMLGSMGLASAIGLGVALARPQEKVAVFDGDGNLLMNLGALAMIGALAPPGLIHCVFDNAAYGSTGNQRSPAPGVRLDALAAAAGYRTTAAATTADEVAHCVAAALAADGPHFILVKVTLGQAEAPRIAHTPAAIRDRFRRRLLAG